MVKCIAPNEIAPWQLDAYRDGVRDSTVVEHVHRCPACAQQVTELDLVDSRLSAALFRFTCPTMDDLMNYQWGLLREEQAAIVARHLTDCPHCAEEAVQLAPPALVGKEQMLQSTPSFSDQIRVLVARLIVSQPTLAPVRADEKEKEPTIRGIATNTVCYEVKECGWDIILNWAPRPGVAFTLQGQLLGPSPEEMETAQVELGQTNPILCTRMGMDGVFVLSPVSPGVYVLTLRTLQTEIQILDLELSSQ